MTKDIDLQIHPLKDHHDLIDSCAAWSYAEWGCQVKGCTLDNIRKKYQSSLSDDDLPLIWIAIQDGNPVGMTSLKNKDHTERKDIGPWVGTLYVHPKYRGQGIGRKLSKFIEEQAKIRGHKQLYLYTSAAQNFWIKQKWETIGTVTDPMDTNRHAHLMTKLITRA